jgi:hypothetical protein
MKKIQILLLVLVVSNILKAQNTPIDTLRYLKLIVNNKSAFIGQSFGVLEDSLQLQIKQFRSMHTIHFDSNAENITIFKFRYITNAEELYMSYPALGIIWQLPLDGRNSDNLRQQFYNGQYNSTVSQYYRPFIIKDIYLIE